MPGSTFGNGNGVSESQLRWGLWFTTHRLQLKRLGVLTLAVVGAAAWLYTIWGFTNHFFFEGERLRRDLRALASPVNPNAAALRNSRPQVIQIEEVVLIPNGTASSDALAHVRNPNPKWLADVEYRLEVAGTPSAPARAVILPGRDRWLTRFNAATTGGASQATLAIDRVTWRRITYRETPDVERYITERFRVSVADATFVPPSAIAASPGAPSTASASTGPVTTSVSRATFTVKNTGAYGLRDVELTVILRRGSAIVGANRITLDALMAGESRAAAATWFQPIGLVGAVEVHPFVNVFDPRAFIERN